MYFFPPGSLSWAASWENIEQQLSTTATTESLQRFARMSLGIILLTNVKILETSWRFE